LLYREGAAENPSQDIGRQCAGDTLLAYGLDCTDEIGHRGLVLPMSPLAGGGMAKGRLERAVQRRPPWHMPTRAAPAPRKRGLTKVR